MYEQFYGLTERPFRMTADPDYLYWSDMHGLAYTMLRYGVTSRAPITVITGEVGTGKTTLIRHLMNDMPADVSVGLVSNMQEGRGDLLDWVLLSLGETLDERSYMVSFQRFQEAVIETYAAGKRTLLIFDEAQNMSQASLEELRMLSNINADKDELLQIVLVGQPELRDCLRNPEMTQMLQRVAADYHMAALGLEDVRGYIPHRLKVAGASHRIFPEESCDLIHEATQGVPRLVNSLADLCLVYGYSREAQTVEPDLVRDFLDGAEQHGIFSSFRPLERTPTLVRQRTSEA